ncbi:MAG: hypothetical protein OEV59_08805 [Deltaproteobacteria bacterium]|nr:hypothetical protein [Deltaproteobacteria bacterium]
MHTSFLRKLAITTAVSAILLLGADTLRAEDASSGAPAVEAADVPLENASAAASQSAGSNKKWAPIQLLIQRPSADGTRAFGVFLTKNVIGLRLGLNYSHEKYSDEGTSVSGLDIGLPNSVNHGTVGLQLAPFMNYSLGTSVAIQIAAVANVAKQNFSGIQISPIYNLTMNDKDKTSLTSICAQAGLANNCTARQSLQFGVGNFTTAKNTLQISALANIAWTKDTGTNGIQFGGLIFNYADSVRGAQIGGILNLASSSLDGLQVGLINKVFFNSVGTKQKDAPNGRLTGMQLGIINMADEVRGVQIGVINTTYKLKGVQIGLINLHYDGPIKFMPILNVGF